MFKERLLSGIVLVLLAFLTIGSGGIVLLLTLLAISMIGMQEIYKVMGVRSNEFNLLECAGYAGITLFYIVLYFKLGVSGELLILAALILMMFVYVFTYPKYEANQIMSALFGLVYVGVMLSFVYQTRMIANEGKFLVWLIFICSWGCDTCAYCVGVLIGKHKMAPVLSPKKSIEGAVGGVAGAALLGVAYAAILDKNMAAYAIICAVGALISMVGDLAASGIKRNQGIKDYGKLIPGHGGILDRFDSVIFTAPIIYYLSTVLL